MINILSFTPVVPKVYVSAIAHDISFRWHATCTHCVPIFRLRYRWAELYWFCMDFYCAVLWMFVIMKWRPSRSEEHLYISNYFFRILRWYFTNREGQCERLSRRLVTTNYRTEIDNLQYNWLVQFNKLYIEYNLINWQSVYMSRTPTTKHFLYCV
jgi:hypothetical protein